VLSGKKIELARSQTTIGARKSKTYKATLSDEHQALLERVGRIRIVITIVARDAAGARRTTEAAYDLLEPKAARR
jgi:hypothetical protein